MTSATHMYNFTADQFSTNYQQTKRGILSVSSTGHNVLVGLSITNVLHIYTANGSHVATLNVPDDELVFDAVFTHRGNIVCITAGTVMVLSMSGQILNRYTGTVGWYFSVSQDGSIYASRKNKIYLSTDDGMSWSFKFSVPDNKSYVQQTVKVAPNQHNEIFWTVESKEPLFNDNINSQLYMYTLNKTSDNVALNVIRSNVTIPTHIQDMSVYSLTFDGHSTIFVLVDNVQDVLMWSVDGVFKDQLQLLLHNSPIFANCFAVDNDSHTMYVGFSSHSIVSVFKMIYESS